MRVNRGGGLNQSRAAMLPSEFSMSTMAGMDTRLLRTFVTVVEMGGVSAAAEYLGYAQSTVSAQLGRLEHDLGVPLLDRTRVGATPNEAGCRLLPHAREALDLDDRLRRAVLQQRPRLRVGALETLASNWLPEIITALDYGCGGPDTRADVMLDVGGREALVSSLAAGRLDIVFLFDNGVPGTGNTAIVGHDRTVVVAAPDHHLARVTTVALDTLLKSEFLIAEPGCTSHMLVDRFGRDVTRRAPVGMITGSFGALLSMAMHGRGVAVLPYLAVARQLESGELVELRLATGLATVHIEARWRNGLGATEPVVEALLTLARRHVVPGAAQIAHTA